MLSFDATFDEEMSEWLKKATEDQVRALATSLGFRDHSYSKIDYLKEWVGGRLAQFCILAQKYKDDLGSHPASQLEALKRDTAPRSILPKSAPYVPPSPFQHFLKRAKSNVAIQRRKAAQRQLVKSKKVSQTGQGPSIEGERSQSRLITKYSTR